MSTETKPKHSPTPWREVTGNDGAYIEGQPMMVGSVPAPCTIARVDYGTLAQSAVDRAHIVACVNAHDALVEALVSIAPLWEDTVLREAIAKALPRHEAATFLARREKIRAALALAKS